MRTGPPKKFADLRLRNEPRNLLFCDLRTNKKSANLWLGVKALNLDADPDMDPGFLLDPDSGPSFWLTQLEIFCCKQ